MISKMLMISLIICLVTIIFFTASKKEKWEKYKSSTFECGYSSYYYSRFNFSIHYLIISLIFLFFDLELCFLMPFMNENTSNLKMIKYLSIFISILLAGLMIEWKTKKLEWND